MYAYGASYYTRVYTEALPLHISQAFASSFLRCWFICLSRFTSLLRFTCLSRYFCPPGQNSRCACKSTVNVCSNRKDAVKTGCNRKDAVYNTKENAYMEILKVSVSEERVKNIRSDNKNINKLHKKLYNYFQKNKKKEFNHMFYFLCATHACFVLVILSQSNISILFYCKEKKYNIAQLYDDEPIIYTTTLLYSQWYTRQHELVMTYMRLFTLFYSWCLLEFYLYTKLFIGNERHCYTNAFKKKFCMRRSMKLISRSILNILNLCMVILCFVERYKNCLTISSSLISYNG